MANAGKFLALLYPILLCALVLNCHGCHVQERKLHIVYMGDLPHGEASVVPMHHTFLTNVVGSASLAKKSVVYNYHRSFNGFAARLTNEEVAKISKMEAVVSVFPSRIRQLHTTRSWDFAGLTNDKLGSSLEAQGDVIVGMLDSGIWPEHESFSDEGYGPPPAKWKGTCKGHNFTCNNKLIGARFYYDKDSDMLNPRDILSPRDAEGHGTHTASTAAGRKIPEAQYLGGLAKGVARGGVPNARIAVYKICYINGCSDADLLKGYDDAIADGVDIISISIGYDDPIPYFDDAMAIAAFHAMKHGILTSAAGGNSGPDPVTVSNYAPWMLTVAASTIDRKFVAQVVLGNGMILDGVSINNFNLSGNGDAFPLIWGGDAANLTNGWSRANSRICRQGSLNVDKIAGKIVLCDTFISGASILLASGLGAIMVDDSEPDVAYNFPLPATVISSDDGSTVMDYIRNTENPVATILVGETPKDVMAPVVASFSSRGPNPVSPDILKPDITAPGVDILAAWSPIAPPSDNNVDTRSLTYNVISGTSMSTPHASGAAAYVKAVHPDWSPAAIKSALMTTASSMESSKHEDLEFAYGSGHINPAAAIDPGLIFDANEKDYVNFLCKQGYSDTNLHLVTGDNSTCKGIRPGRGWDLNYPSCALYLGDGQKINAVFTRTVTNVGEPSIYQATSSSTVFKVKVEPSTLAFSSIGEKKTFTITVTGPKITQQPILSVAIVWSDGVHKVRMPVVVYNYIPGSPYQTQTDSESTCSINGRSPSFRGSSRSQRSRIAARHHH